MPRDHPASAKDDAFGKILTDRAIRPVFQPVVSLDDLLPVGFEALSRGPDGPFATAVKLFAEAERRDRVAELDWICVATACSVALAAEQLALPVFVNVEPDTFATPCPPDLLTIYDAATTGLDLVVEITERMITRPAALLQALNEVRRGRGRIALDDIGSDPSSLNMLFLVRPDVIKLDRSIVQGDTASWPIAYVINAVLREAERTGSAVLAEGIETAEHLQAAISMGATLGQGFYLGRPGPLPAVIEASTQTVPRVTPRPTAAATPFAVVRDRAKTIAVNKATLTDMSRVLEDKALHAYDAPMLCATFPAGEDLNDDTRLRYNHMARTGVTVTAYTTDPPAPTGNHIRGVVIDDSDPMRHQKVVLVIGSDFAGALIAQPREPTPSDAETLYDAVLTYDRALVLEAVQTLIERIPPRPPGTKPPWS